MVSRCCGKSTLVEKWEARAQEASARVPVGDGGSGKQGRDQH